MTSALSGIKVVELTTMITGPLAGMMLADLGAEVVKIENPDGGDYFRSFRGGRTARNSAATTATSAASRSIFARNKGSARWSGWWCAATCC
jgi:crotonobetainyl-CoA:carnitine CoA-transferase CaiB-like acyl-CoA transferase